MANLLIKYANLYKHICKYNPIILFVDCPIEISKEINKYVTYQLLIDFLNHFSYYHPRSSQFFIDMSIGAISHHMKHAPLYQPLNNIPFLTPKAMVAIEKDHPESTIDLDYMLDLITQKNPQSCDELKRMIIALQLGIIDYKHISLSRVCHNMNPMLPYLIPSRTDWDITGDFDWISKQLHYIEMQRIKALSYLE